MSTFKVDVADPMLLPEGIFFHYVTLRCESFVFMCEGSARPIFIVKSVTAILIFLFFPIACYIVIFSDSYLLWRESSKLADMQNSWW